MTDSLITRINAILPQTQCGQCGYAGCMPYAEAIVTRQADINQCPPGGDVGIRALASMLELEYKPLNPLHGKHKLQSIAVIDESRCIGCTLCIQACPVDAIVGASKLMHTVIADECTGCELCITPCPVDCIHLKPLHNYSKSPHVSDETVTYPLAFDADVARGRYEHRLFRIAHHKRLKPKHKVFQSAGFMPMIAENPDISQVNTSPDNGQQTTTLKHEKSSSSSDKKQSAIAAAMAKVSAMKPNDSLQRVPCDMTSAPTLIAHSKPNA